MSDYYNLPPKQKKERNLDGLILLLLLLFLLAIGLTLWSLRFVSAEAGMMQTAFVQSERAPPAAAPPAPAELPPLEETPEPEAVPAAEPEPAPPPPLFSDARWRETARFTGTDASGQSAEFTAYVLVGDETWTFARSDAIFAAGLNEPVETAFANLNLGSGICELNRVIAVGAASVEGTSIQNTLLSYTRGHSLRSAIAGNLPCSPDAVPTTVLDLGYSRQAVSCPAGQAVCPDVSAPQRPIAMILVDAASETTEIAAALKAGIAAHEASGASVLPGVKVSDYSAFDLR